MNSYHFSKNEYEALDHLGLITLTFAGVVAISPFPIITGLLFMGVVVGLLKLNSSRVPRKTWKCNQVFRWYHIFSLELILYWTGMIVLGAMMVGRDLLQ
jgi:hypothetical protein